MHSQTFYTVRMESIQRSGSHADRKIAEYLLSHIIKVPELTVQELAEKTNTGYATVCRFFKKLGVDGFREFKHLVAKDLSDHKAYIAPPPDFGGNESITAPFDEIGKSICDYSESIVSSCRRFFTSDQIGTVISCFQRADHIHFIGLGTSAVTAQYAHTKFFRLKPGCSFDTDIILSKMKATQLGRGNILFAISSSGRTKSILEIAKIARSNHATVISICDFTDSPLANLSDIIICTTVRESNKYVDTDAPLIQGQITLIDILYACMYNRTAREASKSFHKTKRAVDDDKVT